MVLTAPPDSLEAPTGSARPRLSLGVLRQPTTRRKTANRTLANERCARPSASLDPSEQEDASTRLICPASGTRWHPTARTPSPVRVCAEPRKVAGDCFRLFSGAEVLAGPRRPSGECDRQPDGVVSAVHQRDLKQPVSLRSGQKRLRGDNRRRLLPPFVSGVGQSIRPLVLPSSARCRRVGRPESMCRVGVARNLRPRRRLARDACA
jgi:hypothetical protein